MVSALIPPVVLESAELTALRYEVRQFLVEQISAGAFVPHVDTWLTRTDRAFTLELARRGLLGMVVPTEYGGGGRTFLERFVVTEELLAAGAPVAGHWIADRQIAPSLLKYGTEEQKLAFLPGICRGEIFFGIGMSEPDSGSDLASVRTRAEQVEGGWRLSGTKVWTSGAHHADGFFALARSAPLDPPPATTPSLPGVPPLDRHDGLSQFIVDLHDPAVTIRPIVSMGGGHHFNEVHLDGVFVPDSRVLGRVGDGWKQVTSELGFERSGPERFLSTWRLLQAVAARAGTQTLPATPELGALVARTAALHQMSLAVSTALEARAPADTAAAVVKVLGTAHEGDIAEFADHLLASGEADDELQVLLDTALLQRPGFTLRGGTNEILHGVIARGLGLR
ncbi:MAG TPA: acyl-CoA dehydrogenase family protein [Jatrophihabitans sp.]|jgi:alkylation response protein AidB-like acyl-CoA dehydrogenase